MRAMFSWTGKNGMGGSFGVEVLKWEPGYVQVHDVNAKSGAHIYLRQQGDEFIGETLPANVGVETSVGWDTFKCVLKEDGSFTGAWQRRDGAYGGEGTFSLRRC